MAAATVPGGSARAGKRQVRAVAPVRIFARSPHASVLCCLGCLAACVPDAAATKGSTTTSSTLTTPSTSSSPTTGSTTGADSSTGIGTTGPGPIEVVEIHGEHANDHIGPVVRAGDFNGDGLADLALRSPNRVYVVFGSPDPPPVIHVGEIAKGDGGVFVEHDVGPVAIAGGGDVNGDGFADLAIGAPESNSKAGAVYLVFGRADFASAELSTLLAEDGAVQFTGEFEGDRAGTIVSIVGDVTGDGLSDLAVANRREPIAQVTVVHGAAALGGGALASVGTMIPGATIELTHPFGWNYSADVVTGLGDVNGDAFDDVGISISLWTDGKENLGRAYVVFGGSFDAPLSIETAPGFHVQGTPESSLGRAMSGAGDFDLDGLGDVLVGAPGAYSDVGAVYVIPGQLAPQSIDLALDVADIIELRHTSGLGLGWAADSAMDVNGDGFADIVIGSPCVYSIYDPRCQDSAFLVHGGDGPRSQQIAELILVGRAHQFFSVGNDSGDFDYGRYGTEVAGLGDFDGDGHPDFAIGAPSEDPSASNSGRIYVVLGSGL